MLRAIGGVTAAATLPTLLGACAFADLTDHLSGDAVKEYPFLANLPTESWRTCVYNGGIYGLPNFDSSSERSLWKGNPSYSTAVIKKASTERVTELLRVANALAAPFGTKEYLQFRLGVEGRALQEEGHGPRQKAVPIANQSPTLGLYSNTQGSQGAQLTQAMTDAQNEIITGRKPISTWKDAVRDWKQKGGDKVRSEYEESFAASP